MSIFIQIASYRDAQLLPTIKDCLQNAEHPERLVFAICWQHDEDDNSLKEFKDDKRFKIVDVPYAQSKGACWARHQIQQLYTSETYTLQIDSHMRFAPNWDTTLIDMLKQLQQMGHKKPLLTGYVSSYNPENDPAERVQVPWRMAFDRFIPEGAVFFLPETIPDWESLKAPVAARFYSAHFCFTLGEFSKDVQHNPEYYFHGEEISIGVRAYTHGYDLFHPHKVVIWHEYTRKGRTKQWDDDKDWGNKNTHSHATNRKLFGMDGEVQQGHDGPYGFGSQRTLEDFERYAGISFKKRAIQKYTLDHLYPPNPQYTTDAQFEASFLRIFKHCIDINYSQVPEKDYDFWVVAFHGDNDETLYRKDADKQEIQRMLNDADNYCKVWAEFQTESKPKYWVVWPHSESKGWCDRLTGNL